MIAPADAEPYLYVTLRPGPVLVLHDGEGNSAYITVEKVLKLAQVECLIVDPDGQVVKLSGEQVGLLQAIARALLEESEIDGQ